MGEVSIGRGGIIGGDDCTIINSQLIIYVHIKQ